MKQQLSRDNAAQRDEEQAIALYSERPREYLFFAALSRFSTCHDACICREPETNGFRPQPAPPEL